MEILLFSIICPGDGMEDMRHSKCRASDGVGVRVSPGAQNDTSRTVVGSPWACVRFSKQRSSTLQCDGFPQRGGYKSKSLPETRWTHLLLGKTSELDSSLERIVSR